MAGINKNFVIKNGVEIGDNLIYGDNINLKVGIGTTVPGHTLEVRGGIGATSVSVGQTITANSGIVTNLTATNLNINGGTFNINGSTGTNGQYLKSTETGIVWETFPAAKVSDTYIATVGLTTFITSSTYNVGLVDVYVNGVKLSNTEYTATDGINVILSNPTFGGEIVEIVAFSAIAAGAAVTGISGITVKDEGALIGTPFGITSIDFVGAAVTSSGVGAGVTVVIASVGLATDANVNTTGIITASKVRVGLVTTFTEDLIVQGDVRISGILTIGDAFTNTLNVSGFSTFSGDIAVGVDTSTGLLLTSPNGTRYRLIVADNGTLGTVSI